MGLKGKSKLDGMEMPPFDETPVIPDDEDELDKQIKEQSSKDDAANILFERAAKSAELQDIEWDIVHKIGILQLCFNEMADTRRVLWWELFEMRKARKALEAATASSDNIVSGVCDNIVKAQQTPIAVKLSPGEEEQLKHHREELIRQEKEAMNKMHEQFMDDLKSHYTKLSRLKWSGEDGLALHGKWVKWIVGIALTSFIITVSSLILGIVLLVNWLNQ